MIPKIFTRDRFRLLGRLVANGAAQAAATIATAYLAKETFDRMIGGAETLPPMLIAAMALGLILAAVSLGWLRMRELVDAELLAQNYIVELRMALFECMSALSSRALQKRSRGGIMLRFVGDLTAMRLWVGLGIARLTVAGITAGLALSALALTSMPLALATSATLALSLLAAFSLGERLRAAVRESRRRNANIAANINEKLLRCKSCRYSINRAASTSTSLNKTSGSGRRWFTAHECAAGCAACLTPRERSPLRRC